MICLSNFFLSLVTFFCSKYLFFDKNGIKIIYPFFGFMIFKSELLKPFSLFSLTENQKLLLKKPQNQNISIDPKNFDLPVNLPKIKYIRKFHPKKLLKVKEITKSLFDEILFFLLLSLISLGFCFFLFLLIKQLFQFGVKLKTILQSAKIQNFLICENYIYQDKIKENKELKSFSFCCVHYIFDLKKGDYLVLTRDFPQHNLKAGMRGRVQNFLDYQKIEVVFVYDSNFSKNWDERSLKKFGLSLIPERITSIKSFSHFFEK